MFSKKFFVVFLAVLLVCGFAADSIADISNASVLFLRIAPGARPAGMGDAYVAIADDATATHWNPAGLGTYPMSDRWYEVKIPYNNMDIDNPSDLNVLKAFSPLKSNSGNDYQAYDLWVLTSKGLARYDNKRWNYEEVFVTKNDHTLNKIITSYFGITDDEKIFSMAKKVAGANSKYTYEEFSALKNNILSRVNENYDKLESLKRLYDTLDASYYSSMINWERYSKIVDIYDNGIKDSILSKDEVDKISIAVENAKSRFLPEELKVPYSVIFDSEPTAVASAAKVLAFGTENGLVVYNGKVWRVYTTEQNLPSNNITSLSEVRGRILIGTDKGIAVYDETKITTLSRSSNLPEGSVTLTYAYNLDDIWAVIENDLYHFDGNEWSNSKDYTVTIDDSLEKLSLMMSVYETAKDQQEYIQKLEKVNREAFERKSIPTVGNDSTEVPAETPSFSLENLFETGKVIKLPYLNQIKGKVNAMAVDRLRNLWIGTEYGILKYDGYRWTLPGYREYEIESGKTLQDLVAMKTHRDEESAARYTELLKEINDLSDEPLAEGTIIKIYRNPASSEVNSIAIKGSVIYFATNSGLIEYEEDKWRRVELHGLEDAEVISINQQDDEIWFASNDKIVIKANGRSEVSLMHVNWLPELASDMYYEFISVVFNKEGWGTFGINPTFITYGSIPRTNEGGISLGSFDAFDFALTTSYGTSLTNKLKGGISAKIIYSNLAKQGAGKEQGSGTSTGFAVDLGLLYEWNNRLNLGMAVTNLGFDMAYIDAAQADPLPRNFALGFAYKLLRSDYYQLLVTMEANKLLVGLDGFDEIKTSEGLILNGGAEFSYANIFKIRGGYIYDDEGEIKTLTLGFGLRPLERLSADFAYIPSNNNVVLANTLRISVSFLP